MKKTIIGSLIGLLLTSGFAWAGSPEQDPVVAMLREKYQNSRVPTVKDLMLGKTWVCKYFVAIKDDFDKIQAKPFYKFIEFDGIIHNDARVEGSDNVITDEGLTYREIDGNYLISRSLRISETGDLIGERGVFGNFLGYSSGVFNGRISVYGYIICPHDKILN